MTSGHDSNGAGHSIRSGVLLASGIAVAALAIQLIPGAGAALQWQRSGADFPVSVVGWMTGHLAHWSWNHLTWDLVAFLALSFAALRLLPGRYPICLGIAALLIPLEISINQLHLESYRGLSGIDSALFGLILAGLWKTGSETPGIPWHRLLAAGGGGIFLAKTIFELTTGTTVFVSTEAQEFIPAISSHLTGMIAGLIAGAVSVDRVFGVLDLRKKWGQSA